MRDGVKEVAIQMRVEGEINREKRVKAKCGRSLLAKGGRGPGMVAGRLGVGELNGPNSQSLHRHQPPTKKTLPPAESGSV